MNQLPRVLVVTDSDSYVKWGAALVGQIPKDWPVRLVVARGNAEPSPRQLAEALDGTRFEAEQIPRVGLAELADLNREWRPDVILAAARGLAVQIMARLIEDTPDRPVLVSGLAGISVPVIPFGLGFRRATDIFIVHSRRELREFAEASTRVGIPHRYELATVPFVSTAPRPVPVGPMRSSSAPEPVRDRIIFAAQAMVPASRRDRVWLLRRLIDVAVSHPERQVVIKVRARDGEPQTHIEHFSYAALLDDLAAAGEQILTNLVVESGAMSRHLRRAIGLVTVSSTALLEAIAEDIPCLALADFGVDEAHINTVLISSGLLGSSDDLIAGSFRHPDPKWLEDNYFHDPAENTWVPALEELLEQRRVSGLPACREQPRTVMTRLREVFYRHLAFAPEPGSRRDVVERVFLAGALWLNRRRWAVIHAIRHLRF